MTVSSENVQRGFEVNRTYEPYSNDPDYIAGNRGFIGELDLDVRGRVLDLACGVGTLSELMWEVNPRLEIVGVDLSHGALLIARERLRTSLRRRQEEHADDTGAARGEYRRARLVAASADAVPLADSSFDRVIMGHSIHMLADEDRLLEEVRRVLRPGGLFAFNTSFYAGTFVPGTESIYHDWIKDALAFMQRRDEELRDRGEPGIRRARGRVPPAFAKPWPSPEEWRARLSQHGFSARRVFVRTVRLTQYSFETIGAYAGFAEVMLSGYPVETACEALQAAAGVTLARAEIESVPRNWLEFAAERS